MLRDVRISSVVVEIVISIDYIMYQMRNVLLCEKGATNVPSAHVYLI